MFFQGGNRPLLNENLAAAKSTPIYVNWKDFEFKNACEIFSPHSTAFFLLWPFQVYSVTRFGEIWQSLISLWQYFEGLFSTLQNSEPTVANFVGNWGNFLL